MATTTELEARVRELEEKIRSMESSADRGLGSMLDEVFPRESRTHIRNAWKEELLAVRSLLDHWIEKQDESSSGPKRRETISVD